MFSIRVCYAMHIMEVPPLGNPTIIPSEGNVFSAPNEGGKPILKHVV